MQQSTSDTQALLQQVRQLVEGGNAHQPFQAAVKDLPFSLLGVVPEGLPYSVWQLVEHIRIVQWDILEFSRNADHESPAWPAGYWPAEKAPANESVWQQSLEQIQQDRQAFLALLEAPQADLLTPFAHGEGQNLLREALLIGDHTSYHTGQLILIRRLLGAWSE